MPRKPFTGAITDEFGPRPVHPVTGLSTFHYGMDGIGDGNFAPADGQLAGYSAAGGYGNRAVFLDKFGWTHWLAHNRDATPLVQVGQWIPEGTRIAWMGTTGVSTGVHCHWETRRPTGEVVDPRVWLAETASGSGPAGGGSVTPIEEIDMTAEANIIKEIRTSEDRLRREDRPRLYSCTEHADEFIIVNENLPSGDPGKIAYPRNAGQITSLELNYQFVADDVAQAQMRTHKQLETIIALARGYDPVFTPSGNFA